MVSVTVTLSRCLASRSRPATMRQQRVPQSVIGYVKIVGWLTRRSIPVHKLRGNCELPHVHQKFGIDASDDSGMRLRQRVINNIWRRSSCALMRGNCEVLKQGEHRIYHAQRHLPARGVGSASNLLIRPSTWHCFLERIQTRFTINTVLVVTQ